MSKDIPPNVDTGTGRIATLLSQTSPITSSLSPATQTDILRILQREHDHAVALLSLSPLLSGLFVSYANRAAILESASTTPSPESEEWKTLQTAVATLREETEKLKSENCEVTGKLELAAASQGAFLSQVLSLKEINATQQDDIKALRAELAETKEEYDQFGANSNAERAALQIQVFDLEARREELKEAVVEQQIKISRLERRSSTGLANLPEATTPTETADPCKLDNPEDRNMANVSTRVTKTEEYVEQEVKDQAEQEAMKKVEREEQERAEKAAQVKAEKNARQKARKAEKKRAEREAKEKAEQEAREKAEKEVRKKAEKEVRKKAEKEVRKKAEREAKEMAEREERFEREEIERIEGEEKEQTTERAEHEENEIEERKKFLAGKISSTWGSTAGKTDRSRKASGLSREEPNNEWANTWDLNSTDRGKEDRSGLLPTTSSTSGLSDSVGHFDFLSGKKDLPGGTEELELRTPLTNNGKSIDSLSSLSKTVPLTKTTDVGKLDILEGLDTKIVSARISVSSKSGGEHWTGLQQGPSPTEPTPPALTPKIGTGTLSSITSELLGAPHEVKDEAPTTPRSPRFLPAPSLTPAHQSQVPVPVPVSAKTEPERPLSLLERKRLEVASPPVPTSSLFGGGDGMNSSGVLGDISGGGNTKSIAMPTITGDHQSIFTNTTRDQKKENLRENVVEGSLSSNPARRRNDPAQSQTTMNPTPKRAPAPTPAPQKASGWESWLANIVNTVAIPDRTPSPELPPVNPKIGTHPGKRH